VASEFGVPAPHTFFSRDVDDLCLRADDVNFPVILKPAESENWLKPEIVSLLREGVLASPTKAVVCCDKNELIDSYRKISEYDDQMIVQEIIPGEDDNLVYFASYTDRNSKTIAYLAGRKTRIFPVGFGSACYVQTINDPKLTEITLKFLSDVKFQGLSGVEFKKDPRDDVYKLVEVNVRFGLWDGLSTKLGIDLPYVAYRDALGQPVGPQPSYPDGVIWVDFYKDIRAFLYYRKLGKITFWDWLSSLQGEKMVAYFASDDWYPFIMTGVDKVSRFVRRNLFD
jgi:predicted ATP-grasp superfamily ATP-dependent carboligase